MTAQCFDLAVVRAEKQVIHRLEACMGCSVLMVVLLGFEDVSNVVQCTVLLFKLTS